MSQASTPNKSKRQGPTPSQSPSSSSTGKRPKDNSKAHAGDSTGSKDKSKDPPSNPYNYRDESAFPEYSDSIPQDAHTVGRAMEAHGLKYQDHEAYQRYPELREKVGAIISAEAAKRPEPASEKKFRLVLDSYGQAGEATFLAHFWQIIFKDGFFEWVETDDGKKAPVYKDHMLDAGIAVAWDTELRCTMLPHKYKGFEKDLQKYLKKQEGMKNAKPTRILGILPSRLPDQSKGHIPPFLYKLLTISREMYHPFLIMEGKQDQGSTAEARNQARRGCATLVHAARMVGELLNFKLGSTSTQVAAQAPPPSVPSSSPATPRRTSKEGFVSPPAPQTPQPSTHQTAFTADLQTIVFSMTVNPEVVTFYVHWHEEVCLPDGTLDSRYHMNTVFSQSNEDGERGLAESRRVLHNVCLWGAGKRFEEHASIWAMVPDYTKWYHQNLAKQGPKNKRLAASDDANTRASELESHEGMGGEMESGEGGEGGQ